MQGNQEEKFRKFFWLYNKWMYLKNNDIHIISHPLFRESKSVAIYGLGEIGKRLIEELENDGMKISYVIDKNAINYFADFELYTLDEEFPVTECVIITPIYEFESIKENLKNKVNGRIISLEEIIDNLWEESWKEE